MNTNLYVGLAVTAHANALVCDASFDNVAFLQAITTQPQGQTAAPGGSATFSVAVTGIPSGSYQWRLNGAGISGATSSSYTRSNVGAGDAGNYSVVGSNLAGNVSVSKGCVN